MRNALLKQYHLENCKVLRNTYSTHNIVSFYSTTMYYLVQIVSGQFPASLAEMVRVKEIDLMEIETSISSDDLDSDHKCNGALLAGAFLPSDYVRFCPPVLLL